jgi:hypothetical protein
LANGCYCSIAGIVGNVAFDWLKPLTLDPSADFHDSWQILATGISVSMLQHLAASDYIFSSIYIYILMLFDACFYLGASKHAVFFLKTPRSFLGYTMVALMLSHSSYLFQPTYIRILGHDFFKIIERTLTQNTRTPPKKANLNGGEGSQRFSCLQPSNNVIQETK